MPRINAPSPARPFVVGLGASAGGLEALQQFFRFLPASSGLSFVVVQHLSPDYKSFMADILGKYTTMRVVQAENQMDVEPNTVYLIPPKNNMTLRAGKLFLTEYISGRLNHPIDVFFTSLAEENKERAVAVILSGTGSDGTNGAKAIKEHGGLTIVQDPATAQFDGMPRSAISAGLADWVLSPQEIAGEVINFFQHHAVGELEKDDALFSDDETFAHIYAVLKKASGIDFTYYKRTTVLRRIERRLVVTHNASLAEYAQHLDSSPDEAHILVKEILIGVTNFFRDPFLKSSSTAPFTTSCKTRPRMSPSVSGAPAARPARRRIRSPFCSVRRWMSSGSDAMSRFLPPTLTSRPSNRRAKAFSPKALPTTSRPSGWPSFLSSTTTVTIFQKTSGA